MERHFVGMVANGTHINYIIRAVHAHGSNVPSFVINWPRLLCNFDRRCRWVAALCSLNVDIVAYCKSAIFTAVLQRIAVCWWCRTVQTAMVYVFIFKYCFFLHCVCAEELFAKRVRCRIGRWYGGKWQKRYMEMAYVCSESSVVWICAFLMANNMGIFVLVCVCVCVWRQLTLMCSLAPLRLLNHKSRQPHWRVIDGA